MNWRNPQDEPATITVAVNGTTIRETEVTQTWDVDPDGAYPKYSASNLLETELWDNPELRHGDLVEVCVTVWKDQWTEVEDVVQEAFDADFYRQDEG